VWVLAVTVLAALLSASSVSAQVSAEPTTTNSDPQDLEKTDTPATVADAAAPPATDSESFIDKARRFVKEKRLEERFSPDEGFYPRIGGLTTGSGMAAGVGYRLPLDDDRLLDASGVISMKNHKLIEVKGRWWRGWQDRAELWSQYTFHSYPEEDFFGIGPGARGDARTSYKIAGNDILARGLVHLRKWLMLGADVGYYSPTVGHGFDAAIPSIEQRFTDAQAPGLADQPNFFHHSVFVEADARDRAGRPTRGGLYRAAFGTWDDQTRQQFNFRRFDGDASRFFPLHGERHVAAFRLGISYVDSAEGNRIPFYFLPYVGGSDTVRGLREFRYRDEDLAFINAEYRWSAFPHVELAPFFDAGKVADQWQDINLKDMKTSFGVGVRVHAGNRVFFRLDVGTGAGEGTNVFVKFGPSF